MYPSSGKTTFANILLRLFDFDEGELLINDVDIRRYSPQDLHAHSTSLFQNFARFTNATLRENTGFGKVSQLDSETDVTQALEIAGAAELANSLPLGLDSKLVYSVFDVPALEAARTVEYPGRSPRALSGGEWQRVALSRTLMRARTCDLLVLDEPSAALDARAQRDLFSTVDAISRASDGRKLMTVIYITHRLSTIKHADKVAMFENGTITGFGTHEQLLQSPNSSYRVLYDAFTQ